MREKVDHIVRQAITDGMDISRAKGGSYADDVREYRAATAKAMTAYDALLPLSVVTDEALRAAARAVVLAAWTDRFSRLHGHPTVIALETALSPLPAAPAQAED